MISAVTFALRKALRQLEVEKQRIDHQLAALRSLLAESGDGARVIRGVSTKPKTWCRHMSGAARRAVSQRTKTYWATRKATLAKARDKKA
jgi:hypothetical protein